MTSKITKYLQKHGIQPNPTFPEDWAYNNWHNWEEVEKQLTIARGATKFGKNKGMICKMLGVCLEAACHEREKVNRKIQNLQDEITGHKSTNLLLSIKIEQLQQQLKESQLKQQKLGERVEMMLMQSPNPPDIVQIRKLIVSPEDWDGNIWSDTHNDDSDENNYLQPPESPPLAVRPIIKTEETTGPRGGVRSRISKTTPFDPIQIAHLQDRYGRKPGETETEYLWRVSLNGGDRILLDGNEASGYWGPGVFLDAGPNPPNDPHSLTSRVAYWAGGIDALERGEPLLIPIKSLNDLSAAFTKAACIQAMHQRKPTDVPLSATVAPAILKVLIKGAPAMLKPFLIAKRDEIQRDLNYNELVNLTQTVGNSGEEELEPRVSPTWATLVHETVNHAREMGWDEIPNETKNVGRTVRQIKQLHQNNSQEQKPSDRQSRGQEWRNELWMQALSLGIPRAAIQRQPTGVILSLIQAFQKGIAPNAPTPPLLPSPAPREKKDNPFLPQEDQLQSTGSKN